MGSSTVVINSDFGNYCFVCCDKLERANKWIVVQNGLGIKPVDALIKICDVLQVSFEEIQGDWQFKDREQHGGGRGGRGGGVTQALPFCGACLSSFRSVVKLEDQLVEIRRNIQEKLDSIRETIRRTNHTFLETDSRAQNFRSKALQVQNSTSSSAGNFQRNPAAGGTFSKVEVHPPTPPPQQPPPPTHHQLTFNYHPNHNPVSLYQPEQPAISSQQVNFSTFFEESTEGGDGGSPPPSPQNQNSTSESDTNDYYSKSKPSPKKSPPKSRARNKITSTSNQRVSSSATTTRRRGGSEHFSPITYDHLGHMLYENISILPCPPGTPGGYICGKCNATIGSTPNSIALRKAKIHIKGFHLLAYQCPQCSKNFTSNDILNQHLTRYHSTSKTPCPTCGKPIKGLDSALRHHQFTHMNAQEKKDFIASGFKPHTSIKPNYNLPCRICSRVFKTHTKLKNHEETHIDQEFRKDFKCDQCEAAYTLKKSLEYHILMNHSVLKHAPKRTCKWCGKVMFQRMLKNHEKMHKERGAHKCGVCKRKEFVRRVDLERHEKICARYLAVRSHECEVCGGLFKTRRIMLAHMRQKHKGERRGRLGEEIVFLGEGEGELLDEVNEEGMCWIEGNLWSYQVYEVEKLEGKERWRCKEKECGEEMRGEEEVKGHVREKHMGRWRCNKCTKSYKTEHEARVHHRTEHLGLYSHECGVCGRTGMAGKMIGKHLWGHRSVEEAVEKVNEGEIYPRDWKMSKHIELMGVLKGMGEEVEVKCVICGVGGWESVGKLYEHRLKEHKGAKVVKVNRIREEDRKKPGKKNEGLEELEGRTCPMCGKVFSMRRNMLKHGYRVHKRRFGGGVVAGNGGKKTRVGGRRGKKKEVDSEEEEEGESGGDEEKMQEVTVKEEVITSEEEGEEDEEWLGGDLGGRKAEGEGEGIGRRSLRTRRSTRLNVNYVVVAEEEMEEEMTVKQSPPSSEDDEEDEGEDDDWLMGY